MTAPPPRVSELFSAEGLALTRFAYLVCGDRHRAEDLVQEAFLAVYRRFGDRLTVDAPVAYVRRAIVNAHVSRARRRSGNEALLEVLPDVPSLEAVIDPAERDVLWAALRRLPERPRAVLVLRYYVRCDDAEIAELIGARRGTVRSLASRALAELRRAPEIAALLEQGARS